MAKLNGRDILFSPNITIFPVDEHYDPTSDNAQSGKAVAEAVDAETVISSTARMVTVDYENNKKYLITQTASGYDEIVIQCSTMQTEFDAGDKMSVWWKYTLTEEPSVMITTQEAATTFTGDDCNNGSFTPDDTSGTHIYLLEILNIAGTNCARVTKFS